MLGTKKIVVKPLGEFFHELKLFAGVTIMGDGEAVLILDISGVAEFEKIEGHLSTEGTGYTLIPVKLKGELGLLSLVFRDIELLQVLSS